MDCSQITPQIYLGSAQAAKQLDGLQAKGITHIVNIAGKQYFPSNFVYHQAHFSDKNDADLEVEDWNDIFTFIQENSNPNAVFFIHCMGGVSRSPSVVLAWLVWSKQYTFRDALILVKKKRPGIKPRKEFLELVRQIELTQFGDNSVESQDLQNLTKWLKTVS